MAKNLESVDDPGLECILKYLRHPDKLNLRETSTRLYERVTELDNTFKFWTFDPLSKVVLPKFVVESDKSFKIHIKYPTKDSKDDGDREIGDNESGDEESFDGESGESEEDENEMEEEKIKEFKDFIGKYSERVVSLTMSSNEYSAGFIMSLLQEIMIGDQKWKNLKILKICNKLKDKHKRDRPLYYRQFLYVMISDAFFKSCQDSLEVMEFEGVQFSFQKGLRFWNLKSLVLDCCTDFDEFVRGVAPRLEVFKLAMMPNVEIKITGANFTKLKVFEINFNLSYNRDEIIDILSSCHLTIEKIWVEADADQDQLFNYNDLYRLDVDFPKLKSIGFSIETRVARAESILNRCSSSLETLFFGSKILDFSKLKSSYPRLRSITLKELDKETSVQDLVEFLNGCPRLEFLHIDLFEDTSSSSCPWEDQSILPVQMKIENLPLKHLSCPNLILEALSVTSCHHISELCIQDLQLASILSITTLKDLKFPALNIVRDPDGNNEDHVKEIIHSLFGDVQRMKREETDEEMYNVIAIYERAYIPN